VDSVWEQEKLEGRKMLENAAESPASSARFVGRRFMPNRPRRITPMLVQVPGELYGLAVLA
jgi:hypothetical protein